jgi:signal transduction histidine kinase
LTKALASRVAGLKLSGIVAVLLLPMLVLSFFMVSSLREDMAFARRELLGVAMNRLVIPLAINAASGEIDEKTLERFRIEGKPLAEQLNVKDSFNTAIASLLTYGTDPRFAVNSLAKLQINTATASNIILDSYSESYFLGLLLSRDVPGLLSDFASTSTVSSRTLRDRQVTWEEASALLLATGAWSEAHDRVTSSMKLASEASRNPEAYKSVFATITEMEAHPRHIARILTHEASKGLASQLMATAELGQQSSHIVEDVASIWNFSLQGFEGLVHDRLATMQLRLYSFLAIAGLACLIGVGGAALMFRSTLKQLDHVKLAHENAEKARAEAEEASFEVQRINEDVVKLNADLAHNIKMLQDAQEDSLRKGKMAQLGQLTATVAHELRNPLGAVRTSTFLLERKVKGKGLGIEPQLERINNGVTRCDNIISQLLDFARSKALQTETIAFDDWLAKIVEEEAQKLPATVAIECQLALGDAELVFDPARMGRVIINLVTNASEALVGKGDDMAKIAIKSPTIRISTMHTGRGYELTVADNGPGIPPELASKIFEPLFTTKNFGTGLGLPAVQKIMEQHGGGLEVKTQPGQGAEFTAWWPGTIQLKEAV